MNRATEVAAKLGRLLEVMETASATGLRLRGREWFAWATGGASCGPSSVAETGPAELLLTRDGAYVITDETDEARLRAEDLPGLFEVWSAPWTGRDDRERKIRALCPGRVLSDRPGPDEEGLAPDTDLLRWTMLDGVEADRYREVGGLAAVAVTEAARQARRGWTTGDLIAATAASLYRRGLVPVTLQVTSDGDVVGETTPTVPLGHLVVLNVTAASSGLHATLSRTLSLAAPDASHLADAERLRTVEARLWSATRPGTRLDDLHDHADLAFADVGARRDLAVHGLGGVTGYLPLERRAAPGVTDVLAHHVAVAWTLGLGAARTGETLLVRTDGPPEVLTHDPDWPAVDTPAGPRPTILDLSEPVLEQPS